MEVAYSCYSTNCRENKLFPFACYSYACTMRKMEASKLFPQDMESLSRQIWKLAENNPDQRKLVEAVYEIVKTEQEYLEDLINFNTIFRLPMIDMIGEETCKEVFLNLTEIIEVHENLRKGIMAVPNGEEWLNTLGSLLKENVDKFECYVFYSSQQIYAKDKMEKMQQKGDNLAKFIKEAEGRKEMRRLTVLSFLTRPTTRLARYPLLVDAVMKRLIKESYQYQEYEVFLKKLKEILRRVNEETGKNTNLFRLKELEQQIEWKTKDQIVDIQLKEEKRRVIREGVLRKRAGVDVVEIYVFLFDHIVLLTKSRQQKEEIFYRIHKSPYRLDMVQVFMEERVEILHQAPSTPLKSSTSINKQVVEPILKPVSKFPLTICEVGRERKMVTLYAANFADQKQWKEAIEKQIETIRRVNVIFEMKLTLLEGIGVSNGSLLCSRSTDNFIFLGSEHGLHRFHLKTKECIKVLSTERVTQIDLIESLDIFLFLSDGILHSASLQEAKEESELSKTSKIASNVAFFKVGECYDKLLIVLVKLKNLRSYIKVYEPAKDLPSSKKSVHDKLMKIFTPRKDNFKFYREFYIGSVSTSVYFFPTKICIGCNNGFEIVDLDSLQTQDLLDPDDASLAFVTQKTLVTPMAIFPINENEYLICYSDFGFLIDKAGRRSSSDWLVYWKCEPIGFYCSHNHILAVGKDMIEVRSLPSGKIVQILPLLSLQTVDLSHTPPVGIQTDEKGKAFLFVLNKL